MPDSHLPDPADRRPHVAIAILHQADRLLMQLRDNDPRILYPGYWALFGGHLEAGESPEVAVQRELQEEIGHTPPNLTWFGRYDDDRVIRHVYQAPLEVGLEQLVLGEGWDMDWLTPDEIRQGDRFSVRANQVRPLGPVHQKILLDFIATRALFH